MTECKIDEYCREHNEIISFVEEMNTYLQHLLELNITQLADCDSHKLITFFIASYLKDLNECIICFKSGLVNSIPLLLKKLIETWRYIIYYSNNEEEAQLLYTNDSKYKKPYGEKLSLAIDAYIKDFGIHCFEDKSSLFYKDFIRKYYEYLCSFSHLDILALKVSVLDGDAKINFYINAHTEILTRFLTTILILLRLLCELYAKILIIEDSQFLDYYKSCILNLDKITNSRLILEHLFTQT